MPREHASTFLEMFVWGAERPNKQRTENGEQRTENREQSAPTGRRRVHGETVEYWGKTRRARRTTKEHEGCRNGKHRCFFASLERPSVVRRLEQIWGVLAHAGHTRIIGSLGAWRLGNLGTVSPVARLSRVLFTVLCCLFSKKGPHPCGWGLFGALWGAYSSVSSEPVSTMSSEVMGSSEDSSAPESWTWGKRSARASSASRSSSGTGMVSVEMPFSSFLP